jgi:tetratricopeptide (TPR) repeat protein
VGVRERWRTPLVLAALVAAVLAVYWPVRTHGFVAYDDEVYLTENPHVARGLELSEIRWVFTHAHAANYHPLTWVSHMLDVELFGLDAGRHHLMSVALHALNSVLVFFLARALLAGRMAAALAAALFALHPLRVESVAWASERKDVLCALFFLAGLLAYLRHGRAPSAGRYAFVCVLLALALLAKPMAVTFPFVVLLLDVWPLGRLRPAGPRKPTAEPLLGARPGARAGAVLLEKLPLVLLAALGAASTWFAQEVGGAVSGTKSVPLDLRALNALATYGVYLRETFWPAGLAVFHPLAAVVADEPRRALAGPAAAAGLVLVVTSVLAWRMRARRPWFLLGWCWYLGTLVPVIGLKQVGMQAHADRYTYLPLVGMAWIVAGCARELARSRPRTRAPLVVAAVAVVLALALASRRQLGTWRDTRTLFEHALAVTEANHVAHASLGGLDLVEGDRESAARHLHAALEIYPLDATALASFARLYLDLGELELAAAYLERARRVHASKWVRYLGGVLALRRGDLPRAAREFQAAVELDPSLVDAQYNLGQVRFHLGAQDEAERRFRAALALDPEHAGALNGMGVLALQSNDTAEAERLFLRAVASAPEHADALDNLALVLERQGRAAEARVHRAEARRIRAAGTP